MVEIDLGGLKTGDIIFLDSTIVAKRVLLIIVPNIHRGSDLVWIEKAMILSAFGMGHAGNVNNCVGIIGKMYLQFFGILHADETKLCKLN